MQVTTRGHFVLSFFVIFSTYMVLTAVKDDYSHLNVHTSEVKFQIVGTGNSLSNKKTKHKSDSLVNLGLNISKLYYDTPMAKPPKGSYSGFTGAFGLLSEVPLSRHRDTACPKTLKSTTGRIQRYPDVIGIGFAKCGTSTLGFIDCHSKMVFREAEPMYFNSYRTLILFQAYST